MQLALLLLGAWILVPLAAVGVRWIGSPVGVLLAFPLLALAVGFIWVGGGSAGTDDPVTLHQEWIPSVGINLDLRLDGIALLFTLLVLIVGAAVMYFSAGYFDGPKTGAYYPLMVGFAAAMTTLVLADNLVVLFVAWEFTTLCSYLLILRTGPHAGAPATRTLLLTVGGGLALLGAVATIIVKTGTTSVHEALQSELWTSDPTFAGVVTVLIVIAAGSKAAQFPFHFWLPDAMVAPAPVSAYLHAAAMVKAGIFLLLRFAEGAAQSAAWSPLVTTMGLASLLLGAVFAIQRTDLKELLAYSTISHLGLIFVVIGAGGEHGLVAACIHVVAHGIFKAGGFMYVGYLDKVLKTRDVRELDGLWRATPGLSTGVIILAVAMAGVPLTLGFISKEAILEAVTGEAGLVIGLVLAFAGALTVAYSARLFVLTFRGEPTLPPNDDPPSPLVVSFLTTPIIVAAVATLLLGILPGLLDPLILAAGRSLGIEGEIYLALWHGVNTALMLSIGTLVLGTLFVTWMEATHRAALRVAPPVRGVNVIEAAQNGMISFGAKVGALSGGLRPTVHLAIPTGMIAILGGVGLAAAWEHSNWPALSAPGYGWIDAGLLALVLVGCLVAVRAEGTLAMVVAAGIAGMGVGLWFFTLGASDVALTQLMVEILTVVVMVLVIRHLPRDFVRVPRRQAVIAGIVAVGVGVATTVAVAQSARRPEISWAGEWYLANAYEETGGENIVNTILVDFRAFDTYGELVVLALAAISITALLDARPRAWRTPERRDHSIVGKAEPNALYLQLAGRVLVPVMVIGSAYALIRGHNMPGGGFIAALLGAAGLAVAYLAAPDDQNARIKWPAIPIAGAGVLVATLTGILGYADGSFLRPLHADIFGYHFTTALVFDVGVYLAVFGVILGALNRLGTPPQGDEATPHRELTRHSRTSTPGGDGR